LRDDGKAVYFLSAKKTVDKCFNIEYNSATFVFDKGRKGIKMTSPAQFIRQVKQEIAKITWLSRSDVLRGAFVVIAVSVVLSIFLFCVDMSFARIVSWIIGG
jgi:preprotein translocase subunit SecE